MKPGLASLLLSITVALAGAQQTPPNSGLKAPPPRVVDPAIPTAVKLPASDHPTPEATNAPLTADEAARIALKLNPTVASALGAIETAHGRTRQSGAALNPQLVLATGYDQISSIAGRGFAPPQAPNGSTVVGVSPEFRYSSLVEAKQLIYDFNLTRNVVRQNRALEDVALASLTRVQQDLVFAVKNAFYGFLAAQHLVSVNEQNVANRQRQLDLADARLRYEIGLPSDVVTAETSKSQAILALNQARDAAEQARVTLLLAMGVDPLTPVVLGDGPEAQIDATDPKALIATGLKSRPEVLASTRALAANRFGLDAAKSLNLPQIYASLAAGAAGNDLPLKDNGAAFGFGVQFPFVDGGLRAGAVLAARGQVASAVADLRTAILNVQNDVAAAYLELQSVQQRVTIAQAEVANAREGVRVSEGRYSAGLGLFLDITNAQAALLVALTDQETVTGQLNQARARLRHAIGQAL